MKNLINTILLTIPFTIFSQTVDYYQSCFGLYGEELRSELHELISDHTSYSYTTTKNILRESDEDPDNPSNIILVYTGNSIDKFDFSSNLEPDFWNREHVWPKSHGEFDNGDPFEEPAYTDVHNLKPVDSSINTIRGEKDFDMGGDPVFNGSVETTCFSTNNTFEPRDEVKGDIARIILYMDVRYEGGIGEPNLVLVDGLTTYPYPQLGDKSTLLQWHEQDPPDAFEKRRNDIIFKWQGNRNPFIDYPEFADYIFYENVPNINPIQFTNVTINPESIEGGSIFTISANISSIINCPVVSMNLNYGNSWWDNSNTLSMNINANGDYECQVPAQPYNTMFCYSITATICDEVSQTFYGSEIIPPFPFEGVITPISEIQGGVEASPFEGEVVNTSGIVTGAFANSFYIQNGSEPWSGIYVYSSAGLPQMGDSVIVVGEVSEFCWDDGSLCDGPGTTEIYQPDDIYIISNNNPIPEPILVSSGEALQEQYEGVLIKMNDVECISNANGYGVWNVNDGSGVCGIHNTPDGYEHNEEIGEVYSITGVVSSTFNDWKVDLRMESDVESGADSTPPYIANHECYEVGENYYIYLFFNEEIDTDFVSDFYFYVSGGDIQSVSMDMFDPTKVIVALSNVNSTSFIVNVFEMYDLNGNQAQNIFYQFDCNFNIGIDDINDNSLLFPNPAKGLFNLNLKEDLNTIKIYNLQGKLITDKILEKGFNQLEINEKGFFFIEINQSNYIPLIIN